MELEISISESPEVLYYRVTAEEMSEWDKYADRHSWLLAWSYSRTLEMFLANLRRGYNPNLPLQP